MLNFHRPLLAAPLLKPDCPHTNESILQEMRLLRYPVYATLKMDGIRAIRTCDLFSRTLKLIPNLSIRYRSMKLPAGFDCELWSPKLQYDEVESIVMSREHPKSGLIGFYGIDLFIENCPYTLRCSRLHGLVTSEWADVHFTMPTLIETPEKLLEFFLQVEEQEGEGICFRLGNSPYKQGRSTLREQYLVKLARMIRTEVTIIGFKEQMCNTNSEKRNAVGNMDRSSHVNGLVGKGTLGAFQVRDSEGLEFDVGTGVGLTDIKRQEIWREQDKWLGRTIVIKSKGHGKKVKPRQPIYVGLRNEIDI